MARIGSVLDAIGRTPLVRINRLSDELGVTLLGKAEFLNPGGSVKDRPALAMVLDAERRGILSPGGTIVEATAGNTGVGLAMVAATRGYHCVFVMPDKMSADKIALLKAYGAEVVVTRTDVGPDAPENYNRLADRLASEIPGAWRPDQFTNPENPRAHYETTGREILEDAGGRIDAFVAGIGTGGTISGIGRHLKEHLPEVRIIGADPPGSILHGGTGGSWKVEGIGEDFFPETLDRDIVDEYVVVSDADAFAMARRLACEEGLLVGGSSGVAMVAGAEYARRLPAGAVVVVLMPDTGRNYLSKIFSDDWMRENGFTEQPAENGAQRLVSLLARKRLGPPLISVPPSMRARDAAHVMEKYGFSQLPVVQAGIPVGAVDELTFARLLASGADPRLLTVERVMHEPLPQFEEDEPVEAAMRVLLDGSAVVVMRKGQAVGVITPADLVDHWAAEFAEQSL